MHVILWQFTIQPDRRDKFLAAYGPNGAWAKLFRRASGYLGTELLSATEENCFLTMDRWTHASAFSNFQARFHQDYAALDTQLEKLTLSETRLGAFSSEI